MATQTFHSASDKKLKKTARRRLLRRFFFWSACLTILLFGMYLLVLDHIVRRKFEGRRWDIPARVYARPLELYPGLPLTVDQLEEELLLAGYRKGDSAADPGSYVRQDDFVRLRSRPFDFGDSKEPGRDLRLVFVRDRLGKLEDAATGKAITLARLDPAQIGSFHPVLFEDRMLLRSGEIPEFLRKTIIAVEDRNFYSHIGIDPAAILRALWVNIRSRAIVQGGSTITQQLVKNFFLHNRRTLLRKFNEAAMAVLLELHYDKEEILTSYANEVYMGQDGNRAIHGFALAGHFYFHRDLRDLTPDQNALLVGLVKGPAYYNPWLYPERSRSRRAVVLGIMAAQGLISEKEKQEALKAPECEAATFTSGINRFPAFLDVIKRQLLTDYREEDLTANGIKIFTSFDPFVQRRLEEAVDRTLAELENKKKVEGLQAAAVVVSRDHGEIQAIAGDRRAGFAGFNRALDAVRPIGSLVKPAVYLTALENGYTLASPLRDEPVVLPGRDGDSWRPENFDRRTHGTVPLFTALVRSYNLATVNLGLEIGVDKVASVLGRLGFAKEIKPYPSLLLGSVDMSPFEVAQIYQTIANAGFYGPLRGIRKVLDSDNRPLKRYPFSVEQRIDPAIVFLLNTALQHVVSDGTGHSLAGFLPRDIRAAGKTGTSNEGRDSWFAGFTGDRLAVVWLGNDDNAALGLTGATGALPVWGRLMQALALQPLELLPPPSVEWARVRATRYDESGREAPMHVLLPFLSGSAPAASRVEQAKPRTIKEGRSLFDRFKKFFRW